MKKFLKWSAAFLVLGVLAVGCIKPEPSAGIEAMRNAKAALLNAQAALTQAKVQVEAANAALIQAQAGLVQAQEAVVAAQAAKIQAEADLIQAQVEWENAVTDFHKEAWAIKIAELEAQLAEEEARVAAQIAAYELQIANMQDDMVAAQRAYENAMMLFEEWKIQNADTLGNALMAELNALSRRMQRVIIALGRRQVDLNNAKARYLWYVNVEYPEATSHVLQQMEAEKRALECEIQYLASVAEAYDALYNEYHGDLDEMIAGFQETINALRAEIAELEIAFIQLQEEWLLFDHDALDDANDALTTNRLVGIAGVFSDGGDDPNIHVVNGNYTLYYPWEGTPDMFDIMDRDMKVIADTRAEFEDQESGIIEANIKAKKDAADDAVEAYTDNWNDWQDYYKNAQPNGGSLYVAWVNAWNTWNADMVAYNAHLKAYGDMYEEAEDLIDDYMTYLNGVITVEDGLIVLPGATNISEVLGGINFNAGNLASFIFGTNGQAVIDLINVIAVMLDVPGQMDAIVTNLKAIMDGTHEEAWPAFWDHATSWTYKPTPVVYGDIMRKVYANSNRELTDMSKEEWSTWLFLYWLFQDRSVEIGLEGAGTVITINQANYSDAGQEVLEDFFGELTRTAYDAYMVGPTTSAIETAIKNYYAAVVGLGDLEEAMFAPYNRVWKARKTLYTSKGVFDGYDDDYTKAEALAEVTKKPTLKEIYVTPNTYTPKTYDDDFTTPTPDDSPLDHQEQLDPEDVNNFFFVLEAYQDEVGPIPSLDFDITYLADNCDLYVSYAALLAAGEDCGKQWSDWVGDMRLWKWADRKDESKFSEGHYFYAIYLTRDYQAYQDTYNRVENGEYAALVDKIQELRDAQEAAYLEAVDVRDALQDELDAIEGAIMAIGGYYDTVNSKWVLGYVRQYELWIRAYQVLIDEAMDAHNGGNVARQGLLEAWNRAEHELIEKQNELNEIEEALAIYEEGLGLPTFRGFIENETARYQARIDAILLDIENLQQQLLILEGIRADLVADYL